MRSTHLLHSSVCGDGPLWQCDSHVPFNIGVPLSLMTDLNLTPFFDRLSELRTAIFFSVLDIRMSGIPDVVIKDLLSAISYVSTRLS